MTTERACKPWYREPWPWLLMAGPAVVVVAGVITTVIAVKTSDGMVADDYYKQGLGINRTLARDAKAAALGITAHVVFNEERDRIRVTLSGAARPDNLRLTLVHPTRSGGDQNAVLLRGAAGLYESALRAPRAGTWRLRIEDDTGAWRLTGTWRTQDAGTTLGG